MTLSRRAPVCSGRSFAGMAQMIVTCVGLREAHELGQCPVLNDSPVTMVRSASSIQGEWQSFRPGPVSRRAYGTTSRATGRWRRRPNSAGQRAAMPAVGSKRRGTRWRFNLAMHRRSEMTTSIGLVGRRFFDPHNVPCRAGVVV